MISPAASTTAAIAWLDRSSSVDRTWVQPIISEKRQNQSYMLPKGAEPVEPEDKTGLDVGGPPDSRFCHLPTRFCGKSCVSRLNLGVFGGQILAVTGCASLQASLRVWPSLCREIRRLFLRFTHSSASRDRSLVRARADELLSTFSLLHSRGPAEHIFRQYTTFSRGTCTGCSVSVHARKNNADKLKDDRLRQRGLPGHVHDAPEKLTGSRHFAAGETKSFLGSATRRPPTGFLPRELLSSLQGDGCFERRLKEVLHGLGPVVRSRSTD